MYFDSPFDIFDVKINIKINKIFPTAHWSVLIV